MAETEQTPDSSQGDSAPAKLNYKPPPPKSLKELQEMDKDDESLRKYKEKLLGNCEAGAGDGPCVKLQKLAVLVDDHEDIIIDVSGDLEELKKKSYTIKEGIPYKAQLTFVVKNDIVSGMKYEQIIYRLGVQCDKATTMLGSYGPKPEAQVCTIPVDEPVEGFLARGHYTFKSRLTDDDERDLFSWEWACDLKKDWD